MQRSDMRDDLGQLRRRLWRHSAERCLNDCGNLMSFKPWQRHDSSAKTPLASVDPPCRGPKPQLSHAPGSGIPERPEPSLT
jgi:hypothetical protein